MYLKKDAQQEGKEKRKSGKKTKKTKKHSKHTVNYGNSSGSEGEGGEIVTTIAFVYIRLTFVFTVFPQIPSKCTW